MIDKETAQRIKDAADIVDVVSDYVHLTRRGSNYMGLCPFHNERTPSFSVNKRKNFCYCFSCHKGGSPVNFIMEKEGISYHDALLQLAAKYGIEVHERELSDEEKEAQNERDSMFVANAWAMEVMQSNLRDTDEGRNVGLQYFYQRGLTDEAIKAFRLGYAIDRGDSLTSRARNEGYDLELLYKLGLIGKSKQNVLFYDRFRGRVIYPVFTTSGKVVAFGGRTLKNDKSKYINSPESAIYTKSNELYGLYQAKNSIVKEDRCFLVEGYMDVIGMWQAGLQNVVASSGTALTDAQIALIHRFTSKVTLIYDGDAAGIKAALRGIDMLLSHRLEVNVLLLPDGHDPDSFSRTRTPDEFKRYVEEHQTDIVRFKISILLKESGDNPQLRAEAIRSIVTTLACIPDNITRNVYVGECARLLGISESVIAVETRKARGEAVRQASRTREYNRTQPEGQPPAADSGDRQQPLPAAPKNALPDTHSRKDNLRQRLESCEKEVLRYCVKFGMLYFCDSLDADGNDCPMNVCEYINEELKADNMQFSVTDYAEMFDILLDMKGEFERCLGNYLASLDEKYAALRRERFDATAAGQMSLPEMEAAEKRIEDELNSLRDADIVEYTRLWPGQMLASHESDSVRKITTELITAPYRLSRVYSRTGNIVKEADRLGELVPRAIVEWKDALIMIRQRDLRSRIAVAVEKGDTGSVAGLQEEYSALAAIRTQLAKSIGDRIISAP